MRGVADLGRGSSGSRASRTCSGSSLVGASLDAAPDRRRSVLAGGRSSRCRCRSVGVLRRRRDGVSGRGLPRPSGAPARPRACSSLRSGSPPRVSSSRGSSGRRGSPGLYGCDAWSFWVPKAKAIYEFGGLDEQFFTQLPGAVVPAARPGARRRRVPRDGEPRTSSPSTSQYWFFAVGFVWALAGLLSSACPAWILWPFVLLVLVAPRIGDASRSRRPTCSSTSSSCSPPSSSSSGSSIASAWRLVVATTLAVRAWCSRSERGFSSRRSRSSPRWSRPPGAGGRPGRARRGCALTVAARRHSMAHLVRRHGARRRGRPPGPRPTETRRVLWPSLRLAFDVLLDPGYWSVIVPIVDRRARARRVRARRTDAAAVRSGRSSLLVTLGGGWITWAISRARDHARSSAANPDRALHGRGGALVRAPRVRCSSPPRGGARRRARRRPDAWARRLGSSPRRSSPFRCSRIRLVDAGERRTALPDAGTSASGPRPATRTSRRRRLRPTRRPGAAEELLAAVAGGRVRRRRARARRVRELEGVLRRDRVARPGARRSPSRRSRPGSPPTRRARRDDERSLVRSVA